MQYGLIGEHLGHSYSKELHNQIGDYDYILKELPKDEVGTFIEARDFKAINVTIPYKQTVMPYLDHIDAAALEIGAVNTVVNRDGVLYGYNTDFAGLRDLVLNTGLELEGKKVLILGTGGTSKTAQAVAKALNARQIVIASRSGGEGFVTYADLYDRHSDCQVIINATPCGMFPNMDGCPVDLDRFVKLEGVVDVIYNPLRSALVLEAQKRGLKAQGGLFMLVQQAIRASEHFFSKELPSELCSKVYKSLLGQKQNIVLCGMPGSGKTTVGKILARERGLEFVDTDEEIERLTGCHPSQIIERDGEKAFRDIESSVCASLAGRTHCVISTGGGAILREENVRHLKNNGLVFFLDRPLECILPTDDRPLSNSEDKLKALYATRYPIYRAASDHVIGCEGNVASVVKRIREVIS